MVAIPKTYVLIFLAVRFLKNVELRIANDPKMEKILNKQLWNKQTKSKAVNTRKIHKNLFSILLFRNLLLAFISTLKLVI